MGHRLHSADPQCHIYEETGEEARYRFERALGRRQQIPDVVDHLAVGLESRAEVDGWNLRRRYRGRTA